MDDIKFNRIENLGKLLAETKKELYKFHDDIENLYVEYDYIYLGTLEKLVEICSKVKDLQRYSKEKEIKTML